MTQLWLRLRAAWRVVSRLRQLDADLRDELRFHVEIEADRLVRQHGLSPAEARRQAHVSFGGVEKYTEAGRDARGLRWIDATWLDARFGVRMLLKHRGLTQVGAFALAVGIAVGASLFEVFSETLDPTLPFPDGDRVVALHFVGANPGSPERQVLHDFASRAPPASPRNISGEPPYTPHMARDDLQLLQGTLDVLILKTVSRGACHGYEIARWIRETTSAELQVEDRALYVALHRMEERGWLEAEWGLSDNNRRAKYYQLTREGRKELAAKTTTWSRYAAAVSKVLQTA